MIQAFVVSTAYKPYVTYTPGKTQAPPGF
jgi:hypothetical protein